MRADDERALLAWRLVRVSGPSMVPTLRHADLVVARYGVPVRRGDVVLARYRSMPDRLVIKRAVNPVDGGWLLCSDNVAAGGGSDVHGVADVPARVVLRLPGGRWWRPSRLRRAGMRGDDEGQAHGDDEGQARGDDEGQARGDDEGQATISGE